MQTKYENNLKLLCTIPMVGAMLPEDCRRISAGAHGIRCSRQKKTAGTRRSVPAASPKSPQALGGVHLLAGSLHLFSARHLSAKTGGWIFSFTSILLDAGPRKR